MSRISLLFFLYIFSTVYQDHILSIYQKKCEDVSED